MKFLIPIGVIMLMLIQVVFGEVVISNYRVDGFNSNFIEAGATVNVDIFCDIVGSQTLAGAKFYFNYDTNYLDQITEGNITDHLSGRLISKTNANFAPVNGQIRYQRDAAGGYPTVSGRLNCLTLRFHVKQTIPVAELGERVLFTWLEPQADNVKLYAPSNVVISGVINAFPSATLVAGAAPNFNGLDAEGVGVTNPASGNTLNLNWAANGNAANDLNGEAATYFDEGHTGLHNGTGLRFNIARGARGAPVDPPIVRDYAGFTYTNVGLDDGTPYSYRVRSHDACTPAMNEDLNNEVRTLTPTDHRAPDPVGAITVTPANQRVDLSWNPVGGDVGGYLVIRYVADPAGRLPRLDSASTNDPENRGIAHGTEYPVETSINDGGIVIYNGVRPAATDTGQYLAEGRLTNGRTYYYHVIAYDPVVDSAPGRPRQQGRNYSAATPASGMPGANPSNVRNFVALSSSEGITLRWDNPNDATAGFYGGALVVGTTNLAEWGNLTQSSLLAERPAGVPAGVMVVNQQRAEGVRDGAPTELTIRRFGDNPLDLTGGTVYYFKAISYNSGAPLEPTVLASINTHMFPVPPTGVVAGARAGGGGGVAGGGALTASYNLTRPAGGLGINVISFPFASVSNDATLRDPANFNIRGLVSAINAAAGGRNVVQTVGWWDNREKLPAGYIVSYPAAGGDPTFSRLGNAPADAATSALGQDRALQISVSDGTTTLNLEGRR